MDNKTYLAIAALFIFIGMSFFYYGFKWFRTRKLDWLILDEFVGIRLDLEGVPAQIFGIIYILIASLITYVGYYMEISLPVHHKVYQILLILIFMMFIYL